MYEEETYKLFYEGYLEFCEETGTEPLAWEAWLERETERDLEARTAYQSDLYDLETASYG